MSLFKKRYYSFEVGSVKREGRPFRHVLGDLGIQPNEIFFVDRPSLEPVLREWIYRRSG